MVVEVMFRSYVPNTRRTRGSMVKDSGMITSTVVTSMAVLNPN